MGAVDAAGWTALHHAAAANVRMTALALVELGASAAARDNKGRTPADVAGTANMRRVLEAAATSQSA